MIDKTQKSERREKNRKKYSKMKDHTSDHFKNPSKAYKEYIKRQIIKLSL